MPTVHVLGPLACDRVYHVDRLPGRDEKAFARAYRDVVGGPPLWVAAHLAAWGVPVQVQSVIGNDDAGRIVAAELDRRGIGTAGITMPAGLRTATPVVIVDRTGERAIVIDAIPEAGLRQIGAAAEPVAGDWVVSNLFHPEPVSDVVARARSAGAATVVDLELPEVERFGFARAMEAVGGADIVVTNGQFLGWWRPHGRSEQLTAAGACARGLSDGRRTAIVTLGAGGAVLADERTLLHVTAPAVSAVNTTGAGDTFAAGLVRSRMEGAAIGDAVRAGVAAASRFVAGLSTDWGDVSAAAATLDAREMSEEAP